MKKALRKEILAHRDALSFEERKQKSIQIGRSVIEQDAFQKADKILMFASYKSEVDTNPMFEAAQKLHKDIYYPRIVGKEMEFYRVDETTEFELSRFGIREPKREESKRFVPEEGDRIFILMPGAVFDKVGNRIGYGGGFYDRYLEKLEQKREYKNIYKVAVAFACQMVEQNRISYEIHDIRPDCIVTENEVYVIG